VEYIKNTGGKRYQRGATQRPQALGARLPPRARLLGMWGPWTAYNPNSNSIYSYSWRKNQRE